MNEATPEEDREIEEPQEPVHPPCEKNSYKRKALYGLKKALYGLKQAPRTWYGRMDSFLTSLGFTKSKADSNLY